MVLKDSTRHDYRKSSASALNVDDIFFCSLPQAENSVEPLRTHSLNVEPPGSEPLDPADLSADKGTCHRCAKLGVHSGKCFPYVASEKYERVVIPESGKTSLW